MTVMSPLQRALLGWGEQIRRDLPWRRTRDPWAILVSELMLQQTQVARVMPRYVDFLARFPTPAHCAAAPCGEVVRAWAGLGYNRRAVNLHRAAVAVVERHKGSLPSSLDALLALPGVGAYTARAVLAFAFGADVGVVDVNASRVLARAVAGKRLDAREAQALADRLVPPGQGWAWNQAILDLGATVCTARTPACERCPLATTCAWTTSTVSTPSGSMSTAVMSAGGGRGPDPAQGSAGCSGRQSTFAGSDRQGRGRLVDALRLGPVPLSGLPAVTGWPDDPVRARRVAEGLVADGLARLDGNRLTLP
jgi:A/G-specific adenine glycosylase